MVAIKKILCPVDFFEASKNALRYATALAESHDAKLKLLHVVAPIIPTVYPYPPVAVDLSESMTKSAKEELRKLLARRKLKTKGIFVESEVTSGDVVVEIQRAIASYKPDIVTMGTHGRRGFERWIMGSTTERLLRHSPVPLLTITGERPLRGDLSRFRRILVTTDFSDGTRDTLEYALTIAQENDAHLTLLHILDREPTEFVGEDRAVFFREIDRKLWGLVPPEAKNWCDVSTRIEKGIPYRVILNIVKNEKIDLVVMNIHGKGMIDRALLGSTAERVVRGANCPTLLVPPMGQSVKKVRSKKNVA